MKDEKVYPVDEARFSNSHVNERRYREMYKSSIENPEVFWAEYAEKFLTWNKRWESVSFFDFHKAKISWFEGAKLNASANCLDRHLPEKADQIAILWEGDDPSEDRKISYRELYEEV